MNNKTQINSIINALKQHYENTSKTSLNFSNPLEILVSTILSAQCTDIRVNKITPAIFKKYKTARDYAKANIEVFEQEIKSAGFFHTKAKNIIKACKIIEKKYKGRVPDNMNTLLELPGVARKTANIVLGNGYGVVVGIAVDTHVRRLSKRMGLTKNDSPEKIEQDLMNIVDKSDWFVISNIIIEHGRTICRAIKPDCSECFLLKMCPKIGVTGNQLGNPVAKYRARDLHFE